MYKNHLSNKPLILGVITARGGSKGIPGKNIKLLGGEPLIAYTIDVVGGSKYITQTIVSTDDEGIAKVCRERGAEVPFIRPKELATDTTPHLPVLQHAVNFMEAKQRVKYDYVVILQPTSPFRTREDIDQTLRKLINSDADSAVTMTQVLSGEHPMKIKKVENGLVLPYCMEELEGTRRQDLPAAYKRSGAVYAIKRDVVMAGSLYGKKTIAHIVPGERSIDIDSPFDWFRAEYMLERLKNGRL